MVFLKSIALASSRLVAGPARTRAALLFAILCGGAFSASAAPPPGTVTKSILVPFSPQNGNRQVRSLSVHPNGQDWLFVECLEQQDYRCDVMRYDLTSGKLFRYTLSRDYTYTYAHYSPRGTYILMSRRPRYGTSKEQSVRASKDSQLLIMQSDGTGLAEIPVAPGVKLAPFMSPDETRIAFWRSGKILPPNNRIGLMEFDIWEFDLASKSESLFSGKRFEFATGGNLQYIRNDEILFRSYGPDARFEAKFDYRDRYDGSHVYRLRRGQMEVPEPVVYPDIRDADLPSIDKHGNTFLWGHTSDDRTQGIIRIASNGAQTIWRTRTARGPWDMTVDPNGEYLAAIYWDLPQSRTGRLGGFAKLDPHTATWTEIRVPAWEEAKPVPVPPPLPR